MKIRFTALVAVLFALLLVSATAVEAQAQSAGYKLAYVPNPDVIEINLNRQVGKRSLEMTYDGSYMPDLDGTPKSVLMKRLTRIAGVTDVTIKKYQVTIGKGAAFSWRQVMPRVMAVLKHYVAPRGTFKQLGPPEGLQYSQAKTRKICFEVYRKKASE